jgi:hypothetical protein
MHPGNAAVVPRSSDTLLLGPVEANVAELRRRTPAWDEIPSCAGARSAPASLLHRGGAPAPSKALVSIHHTGVVPPVGTATGGLAPVVWDVIRRITSETAGALEPDRVARAVGGRASVTCVQADSDCVLQSVEACSRRHGAEARRAILLVARKRARGVLLSARCGGRVVSGDVLVGEGKRDHAGLRGLGRRCRSTPEAAASVLSPLVSSIDQR